MIPEPALSNSPISSFTGYRATLPRRWIADRLGENGAVGAQDRDRVRVARHRGSPKPYDVVGRNRHLRHAIEIPIPLQAPVERKQVLSGHRIEYRDC